MPLPSERCHFCSYKNIVPNPIPTVGWRGCRFPPLVTVFEDLTPLPPPGMPRTRRSTRSPSTSASRPTRCPPIPRPLLKHTRPLPGMKLGLNHAAFRSLSPGPPFLGSSANNSVASFSSASQIATDTCDQPPAHTRTRDTLSPPFQDLSVGYEKLIRSGALGTSSRNPQAPPPPNSRMHTPLAGFSLD